MLARAARCFWRNSPRIYNDHCRASWPGNENWDRGNGAERPL